MWIDDQIFKEAKSQYFGEYWEPKKSVVVLGRSNVAETECVVHQCHEDNIEILQRSGGGGTVVLFPGCAIVSCGMWVSKSYHNDLYFRILNQSVMEVFANELPIYKNLKQSGISDISFENRKCAGTSLFRSRNYLLYQASIIVDCDIAAIERYLAHPSREPDYRQNRDHREFVVGLAEITPQLNAESTVELLRQGFEKSVRKNMSDELIDPVPNQIQHIIDKSIHA